MSEHPENIPVFVNGTCYTFERGVDAGEGDPWWDNDDLRVQLVYNDDSELWCMRLQGDPEWIEGYECYTPAEAFIALTECCRSLCADTSAFLNKTGQQEDEG